MTFAPSLFDTRGSIDERFEAFDREHPEVFAEFRKIAEGLLQAGETRYSADAVLHIVRWHRIVNVGKSGGWKVNNDFTALFARKLMREDARFQGFFELRARKSVG